MNLPELRIKLQLKPSHTGRFANVPTEIKRELVEWPATMLTRRTLGIDYVVLFVNSRAELRKHLSKALKWLREDGILWIAYPKKSSGIKTDIDRDHGWEPVFKAGLKGVRAISIDEDWTALRFRHKT